MSLYLQKEIALNIYDIESCVIGTVLRYSADAPKFCLPELTHGRFVYGMSGKLGEFDHQTIWQAIETVHLQDHLEPNISNVAKKLKKTEYLNYLNKLVERLINKYGIHEFDPKSLQDQARAVDKAGILYNASQAGGTIASVSMSEDFFLSTFHSVEDIDEWLNNIVHRFSSIIKSAGSGYRSMGDIVDQTLESWRRMKAGEQLSILPSGMPCLLARQLFPTRSISVIHGMASAGKTAFVLQVLLGTAIGLKNNNIKGCVAFNSLEMSQEAAVSRMASMLARVDYTRLRGGKEPLSEEEFERLTHAAEYIRSLPLFVDDTSFLTTSAMQYRATGLNASEHGPIWQLGTDYGELFSDSNPDSKEQKMDTVFRNQFYISRLLGCSVLAISQSTFSDASYIAGPNGLRYSTGIRMSADIICELWNPLYMTKAGIHFKIPDSLRGKVNEHCAWLLVQKYRDGGMIGAVPLGWTDYCTSFHDLTWVRDELGGEIRLFNHTDIEKELLPVKKEEDDVQEG